jgi:hypothetical protein
MAVIPFPISTETIIFTHHPPPATIKKNIKSPLHRAFGGGLGRKQKFHNSAPLLSS